MKRLLISVIMIWALFTVPSCVVVEDAESVSIADSLKISTWVLDEELEGRGYWAYDDNVYKDGYWISNNGNTDLTFEDIFVYEELTVNTPRTLAPLGSHGSNINITFEFDGIVHIKTDPPNDGTVQILRKIGDTAEYTKDFKSLAPVTINFFPIGKTTNYSGLIHPSTLVDREYYLDVACYKLDGSPVIFARLKFVVLDDPNFPWYEKPEGWLYTVNDKRSRFLSIELVEYEYSDIKKFDEFEKYDALYN